MTTYPISNSAMSGRKKAREVMPTMAIMGNPTDFTKAPTSRTAFFRIRSQLAARSTQSKQIVRSTMVRKVRPSSSKDNDYDEVDISQGITRRIRRRYSRTNVRTASIEYLSQNRGQFGYEDNRKIVQWMKTNRVVSFAQNREAFGKLITEFGFDNKKYAAKRELLVTKLKTRVNKMRKEMERDGKIVITRESGKIKDVQFIDSDVSDGC
jgi:hypothetical protein